MNTADLDLVYSTVNGRQVAHLVNYLTSVKVASIWGYGTLVYVTQDGWAGVQLHGETRVDEYPVEALKVAR